MSEEKARNRDSAPITHHSPHTTHHSPVLYYFCRLQLPSVALPAAVFERHLERTFELFRRKAETQATWQAYLDHLYAVDWYLAVACLERNERAWEQLFAARAYRTDCLLIDALRSRAARLYPGNEEQQESAVTEFWSQLLVSESVSLPVLARYDGQRPLVPWLIRVFQNLHISQLRHKSHERPLPEDDLSEPLPAERNGEWHEAFCAAAREWLTQLKDNELLILGLRLRFRMSQREAAQLLGIHEGNVSRQTTQLRDRCLAFISHRLLEQGWTGDDLSQYVLNEMAGVLLDEPRLSADRLAVLLKKKKNEQGTLRS